MHVIFLSNVLTQYSIVSCIKRPRPSYASRFEMLGQIGYSIFQQCLLRVAFFRYEPSLEVLRKKKQVLYVFILS